MKINPILILDCDTGEDDAIAIVLAIMSGLPLKYIVTCHGNTTLNNATRNSSRIASLLEARNIKVIKGSLLPYRKHKFEAEGFTAGTDFLGKNGICDIELPPSKYDNVVSFGNNDEYIPQLAKILRKEGKVDYIVTGPCTNFAKLCEYMGKEIKRHIDSLYIMGGAIYAKGTRAPGVKNTSHEEGEHVSETWAEFNFYCDPEAVKKVLSMNFNPTLVTWDVCKNFELPIAYINSLSGNKRGNQFIVDLMQAFMKLYGIKNKTKFELCDPLTIMAYMGYGQKKVDKININTGNKYYAKSFHDDNGYKIQYFYPKSEEDITYITSEMMDRLNLHLIKSRK